MSIRTANIEVSLQALTIQRIEHPQANPLRLACTLRAGETFPSGLTVTAEIHTSRNVPAETTPLASSTVTVTPGATSFEVLFDSPQTNQAVAPESVRACWLVLYGVDDENQVHVLSAADLLLGWHAISQLTAAPPNVTTFVEKGGVAWATGRAYASGTMVTVGTTAYIATSAHTSGSATQPGTGASWATVWAVFSGGDASETNLALTLTATAVTITNDNGDGVEIPAADNTNAGVFPAAAHVKLAGLPTAAELTTALSGKSNTSHTHGLVFIGDVTGSGNTGADVTLTIGDGKITTAKIANLAVTNAKLANVNAATIKSNLTGGPAAPQDNSVEDVATAMPVYGSAQRGLMPAFGAGTNGRVATPVGWTDTLAFGTLTASDPLIITQTWNNGAVVFTGLDMVITQTAANSSSYFLRFRGGAAGATDRFFVQIDGTTTQAGGANWLGGACGLNSSSLFLNDGAARIQFGNSAGSPNLRRETDNALGLRNGTNAQALRIFDTHTSDSDYHRLGIATARALLSSLSGASVTASALIPAGAIVVGVTAKVLTAITGATSWQLGTAADPDRFAAAGGIALGSTTDNRNWTSGALECFLTATNLVLTANGANFTGGAIYISVQYIRGESD